LPFDDARMRSEIAHRPVVARLQQFIAFLLVAVVAATAGYFMFLGPRSAALLGAGVVIGGYWVGLGLEFFYLRRSYSSHPESAPPPSQFALAWYREMMTAPLVFLGRQPFRSSAIPDSRGDSFDSRRGVVLVHGFFCNRGLWNPWMRVLRSLNIPFRAVSLEPVFASIDEYSSAIANAVAEVQEMTRLAPVIVAHSMGGLAVRAWLAKQGAANRVHHVVTIATPHRGTCMARRGFGRNVAQMRIGSTWLSRLQTSESGSGFDGFTCFWSRCDNIVFPTDSATLPGAQNRELAATPHVRMVYHPEVLARVMTLLDRH